METESALYQLMGVRMNGVMNGITNSDGEYQEIIRKPDEYSGKLDEPELPEEICLRNSNRCPKNTGKGLEMQAIFLFL